jgi:hypothetical protein
MTRYRNAAGVLAAAATTAALAGCGPAGSPVAAPSSARSAAVAPSSAASPSPAPPTDAAGLAGLLKSGADVVHSAHVFFKVQAGTAYLIGSGEETLDGGDMTSLDLTEDVPNTGRLRMIMVGGETYLEPPATLKRSTRRWVLVSPASTSPEIQQLFSTLDSVRQTAWFGQFTGFGSAAAVISHEPSIVDGATTTHYRLSVDVAQLPRGLTGTQLLKAAGIARVPVEVWVDKQGRPVKFTQQLDAQGHTVTTELRLAKFNAPVTISPPPADQVATH